MLWKWTGKALLQAVGGHAQACEIGNYGSTKLKIPRLEMTGIIPTVRWTLHYFSNSPFDGHCFFPSFFFCWVLDAGSVSVLQRPAVNGGLDGHPRAARPSRGGLREFLWDIFLGVFGEVPWIKQEVTKIAQRLWCYVAL